MFCIRLVTKRIIRIIGINELLITIDILYIFNIWIRYFSFWVNYKIILVN